nr:hypothetical protein [Tanacetum cinerariifolium]
MHNNIMAAGSQDRPYTHSTVIILAVPATDDSPEVPERTAHQKEVNEIRAERIAKNANPLALLVATQPYPDPYYQAPKSHKSYAPPSKQSSSTIYNASTKYKGKEIAKPITPPYESASEEDSDPEQAQRDKGSLGIRGKCNKARETVGSQLVQQTGIQCFNCKEFGHFAKEYRKPKKEKDSTYHKVKMLLCKQAEKGVSLQAEQADWLEDTDEEIDEQELEAHYNYIAKIQEHSEQPESINNTCSGKVDSNVIPSSPNMCNNDIQPDKNAEECDDEPQLQDKNIAISELKKLIEKCKGKYVETKFDKPFVVRQPNAQRISKPLLLGKPTHFTDSLERKSFSKTKSVPETNVSEGLSKPVTTQILPQTARQAVRNTNVIKPRMYQIDTRLTQTIASQFPQNSKNTDPRVSTSTGVIHRTNVSRPQLRSTQIKDKVMPNNSLVKLKKTEVEDHHRISSISNKTKSVTACNDSLRSRTSCATCGKCVFNSNHDTCVSKSIHDVNARSKKPKVVPISTRKPKSQANKSVATLPKKTVASESTIQKSKSYYRMLYEKSSKADLQGNDLLTGNRRSDLYIISLHETTSSTPICFMAKALPTQAWLWHQRLSHLNFDYINLLSKKDIVIGLPKLKYVKDQLYTIALSQQELDLLFGPLYDEFFTAGTLSVNKSSSPIVNSKQEGTPPTTNIQSLTKSTTLTTNVNAEENNNNKAEDTYFRQDEFINLFCTPIREIDESSSRNIEEVYVAQPDGFVDPDHQKKVYRLRKALYGLKQSLRACRFEMSLMGEMKFFLGLQIYQSIRGIFINQAKYALEILKKHGKDKCDSVGTPMATKPKLDTDLSGKLVDQTDYRSKIRPLTYLTSSRPDIVQADFTAMSSAEAEYVTLSASYVQVMWMRTQL